MIFWGLASFITPPVCLAVFVACSISGAKVWETGFEAIRLGIGVFIGAIAFALNPPLIMQGSWQEILFSTLLAMIGGVMIAVALQGYAINQLSIYKRMIAAVAGVLFFIQGVIPISIAFVLLVILLIWELNTRQSSPLQSSV